MHLKGTNIAANLYGELSTGLLYSLCRTLWGCAHHMTISVSLFDKRQQKVGAPSSTSMGSRSQGTEAQTGTKYLQ